MFKSLNRWIYRYLSTNIRYNIYSSLFQLNNIHKYWNIGTNKIGN